jgi:protein phosphatase PTC7
MTNCNDILKEKLSLNDYNITHNPTPQQLLDLSYKRLIDSKNVMAGSSTASIVQFDKVNSLLNTCNLGDSGYIIIRDFNQIIYKSKPMHHFFNCPYQLSLSPEDAKRGLNSSDSVNDSQTTQHKLYPNDLVIVATDGLFDNLFDEETLSIVQNEFINISPNMGDSYSNSIHFSNNENYDPTLLAGNNRLDQKVRKLAQKLTDTARRLSYNKKRMSPWAQYAIENGYPEEIGG